MEIEAKPTGWLKPYENNPRDNDGAVEAVANSIREFGFRNPILAKADGEIIAGHTRLKAAVALGLEEVPVIICGDLTDEQARALRLADNKTGELAAWNEERLLRELGAIEGIDMSAFGFDAEDLPEFGFEAEADPDSLPEGPEEQEEPTARRGQMWRLGEHVLMCGDSTSKRDVAKLMQGAKADMVFTDPPWNVAYSREILNDDLGESEFLKFMEDATARLVESVKGGGAVYVVMGIENLWRIMPMMERKGLHWSSTIIWVKDQFTLTRKDYHLRYEPIWYGWESSEARAHPLVGANAEDVLTCTRKDYHTAYEPIYYGWKEDAAREHPVVDRRQDDVWEFPRPKSSEEHPMMKPVELVSRALENSSEPLETVLDLFGGSGTTLMACEATCRKCRTMELDPHYCDVIIRRWEEATGRTAELMEEERWRPCTSPSEPWSAGFWARYWPTSSPTSSPTASRGGGDEPLRVRPLHPLVLRGGPPRCRPQGRGDPMPAEDGHDEGLRV